MTMAMNRTARLTLAAFLVVATIGLATGCSEDGESGASLVTTTAASGDDSTSDTTEAPTTTAAATKAPDTTQSILRW